MGGESVNSTTQQQIELASVLNLIPYLDTDFNYSQDMRLANIVKENEKKFENDATFKILKKAIEDNPSYGEVMLVDQSSTNSTLKWKDDLIQGCTFRDPEGNYYVSYRGTGDGRWIDNGLGMTNESTAMQEAAREYFDSMAEKYFIDADANGKQIIVTGHSKGGNEAQYVYMTSKYEHLIDKCYSYDGQGFSGKARDYFIEKYGENYQEKLSDMYSICGKDDYVHDLGYVIIPEDNTYFVETTGSFPNGLHALENMLADDNGNYTGFKWEIVNSNIVNGEQGDVGALAKELSRIMMQLDDDDLDGAAIAIMSLIDRSNDNLSAVDVGFKDWVDLVAHGGPAVLKTLFLTEAGHNILRELAETGVNALYERFGVGGTIGILAAGSLIFVKRLLPILVTVAVSLIVIAKIMDFVIDAIDKIKAFGSKVKDCFIKIKNAVLSTVKKIINKFKGVSGGEKYAIANPQIIVDTYKLERYAQRLNDVNRRINNVDRRLDSLYWKVGLLDIWKLLQADILTGYSWRLNRCATYLNDTASDFANVEKDLLNKTQ